LASIEEIFESILKDYQIVGGSIAIAKDGRLVLARGVGMADSEAKKPVTPQTLFSIASVSKPVSAIAILKLAELGKLKLDTRLIDLLDDIKPLEGPKPADPRFKQITIHQILYHGSGLAHDTPAPGKAKGKKNEADDDDDDLSTERQVEIYRNALSQPLDFAPGTDHKYSNVGYSVLQLVISRVTGQSYPRADGDHPDGHGDRIVPPRRDQALRSRTERGPEPARAPAVELALDADRHAPLPDRRRGDPRQADPLRAAPQADARRPPLAHQTRQERPPRRPRVGFGPAVARRPAL
jgi:hypothetical protein